MEVKRREGENPSAFLYRFTKKVRHSGILREVKKRKFKQRPVSRRSRRLSAIHREGKKQEVQRARKLGIDFTKARK